MNRDGVRSSGAGRTPVPSLQRLRQATARGLAGGLVVLAISGLSSGDRALGQTGGSESPASRWKRLESMPAQEKEELLRKSERFYRLRESEQERLRELEQQLSARRDAAHLREVMKRYAEWLRSLSARDRADLLSLSIDQRLTRIRELKRQQEMRQWDRLVSQPLPPGDLNKIYTWLDEMIQDNEQSLLDKLSPEVRQSIEDETDELRRRRRLMFALARLPSNPFDEQDVERLVAQLSPEAGAALAKAATQEDKDRLIRNWWRSAVFARINFELRQKDFQDKLTQFYENDLSPDERQRLDDLPADQMLHQLQWLYFAREGGFRPPRGGRGRWGEGRGGDGRGRGGFSRGSFGRGRPDGRGDLGRGIPRRRSEPGGARGASGSRRERDNSDTPAQPESTQPPDNEAPATEPPDNEAPATEARATEAPSSN